MTPMRVLTVLVLVCVLGSVSQAPALDLPPWMPDAQVVQVTDIPFQTVTGTVALSDLNDARDVVGNRDFGNQGGFLLKQSGGTTFFDCPGAVPYQTTAHAVNRTVEVVGACAFPNGQTRGYLYTHSNPSNPYRLITISTAPFVAAYGVNDFKHVVGEYVPVGGIQSRGFWWSNGSFQAIDVPFTGRQGTVVHAVTNTGRMAGYWIDAQNDFRGFTRASGITTMLDVPGARWTIPLDMNEAGTVVGWYRGLDDTVGPFVFDAGVWWTVVVTEPNVVFTEITGLNNRAQLAGRLGLQNPGGVTEVLSRGLILIPSPDLAAEAAGLQGAQWQAFAAQAQGSPRPAIIPHWPAGWRPRKGQALPWP